LVHITAIKVIITAGCYNGVLIDIGNTIIEQLLHGFINAFLRIICRLQFAYAAKRFGVRNITPVIGGNTQTKCREYFGNA
jgi:hypothetical protein